jgi:hypothetical protein
MRVKDGQQMHGEHYPTYCIHARLRCERVDMWLEEVRLDRYLHLGSLA